MTHPATYRALASTSAGSRKEQQDFCDSLLDVRHGMLLAVLCDGAGGHSAGREAADAALACAKVRFRRQLAGPPEDCERWLAEICGAAQRRIKALESGGDRPPCSTIVLLLLLPGRAFLAHIGDSRIYHLRNGKLLERTRDHSRVQELRDQGLIAEDEMGAHPEQGKLLRALGMEEDPAPTVVTAGWLPGDYFLLCSDGLWERLTQQELESFFAKPVTRNGLDQLVASAVLRNGQDGDNTTAMVVEAQPLMQTARPRRMPLLSALLLLAALAIGAVASGVWILSKSNSRPPVVWSTLVLEEPVSDPSGAHYRITWKGATYRIESHRSAVFFGYLEDAKSLDRLLREGARLENQLAAGNWSAADLRRLERERVRNAAETGRLREKIRDREARIDRLVQDYSAN